MHRLKIIAVGRIKHNAGYLIQGIELYRKRLSRYARIEIAEIPEQSPSTTKQVESCLAEEADAILRQCEKDATCVLLSEHGQCWTSLQLAERINGGNPLDGGRRYEGSPPMIFIIGGAYGTSETLTGKVNHVLSLSPMTFPHQLVRLLLMEQLYRAFTIIHGEPYHKD